MISLKPKKEVKKVKLNDVYMFASLFRKASGFFGLIPGPEVAWSRKPEVRRKFEELKSLVLLNSYVVFLSTVYSALWDLAETYQLHRNVALFLDAKA